jgi:hypothetical protein
MKNLSVLTLARKILFCSIIFPHSHKRTCSYTPTAPVRFVYGYGREGEGSRGSWNFTCSKKGQVFLLLKKRVYPPPLSITVPTWSEKNGENYIRDIQNNLLSISLIVIKYTITCKKCFSEKKKVGGLTLVHSDRGCHWLLQTPTRNCPSRTQFDTWCYPQSRKYQPKIIKNISVLFTELFVIDILTLNTCRSLTNYW